MDIKTEEKDFIDSFLNKEVYCHTSLIIYKEKSSEIFCNEGEYVYITDINKRDFYPTEISIMNKKGDKKNNLIMHTFLVYFDLKTKAEIRKEKIKKLLS